MLTRRRLYYKTLQQTSVRRGTLVDVTVVRNFAKYHLFLGTYSLPSYQKTIFWLMRDEREKVRYHLTSKGLTMGTRTVQSAVYGVRVISTSTGTQTWPKLTSNFFEWPL